MYISHFIRTGDLWHASSGLWSSLTETETVGGEAWEQIAGSSGKKAEHVRFLIEMEDGEWRDDVLAHGEIEVEVTELQPGRDLGLIVIVIVIVIVITENINLAL